jgi:hypothetical protein
VTGAGGANVGLAVGLSVGSDVLVGRAIVGDGSNFGVEVTAAVLVGEVCRETDVQDGIENNKSMENKKYLAGTGISL